MMPHENPIPDMPKPDPTAVTIDQSVDDLNIVASQTGLTIRLKTDDPEADWPALEIRWDTLSEWYARIYKQAPDGASAMVQEAIRIHDDHKVALGGLDYQQCHSPSCWAARKVIAASKGVSLGGKPRVHNQRRV
jgi:hypothetical protein